MIMIVNLCVGIEIGRCRPRRKANATITQHPPKTVWLIYW